MKLPQGKTSFGPCEILKDSIHSTAAFILLRPVLFVFSASLLVLVYAAVNNRKVQGVLLTFPYERLYRAIKSDRMITFYATIVEVIFEVVTAVILAGVSILITSWLLLEEASDRRHNKSSSALKTCGKQPADVQATIPENEALPSPRYSQHEYFISPTQSRTSRWYTYNSETNCKKYNPSVAGALPDPEERD